MPDPYTPPLINRKAIRHHRVHKDTFWKGYNIKKKRSVRGRAGRLTESVDTNIPTILKDPASATENGKLAPLVLNLAAATVRNESRRILELPDDEFYNRLRMTREQFDFLLLIAQQVMADGYEYKVTEKLVIALDILFGDESFRRIEDRYELSKGQISHIFAEFLVGFASLSGYFINPVITGQSFQPLTNKHFSHSDEQSLIYSVFSHYGFSGSVDGSCIKIDGSGINRDNQEKFRCHKLKFALGLNVFASVNQFSFFDFVDTSFAGSAHDYACYKFLTVFDGTFHKCFRRELDESRRVMKLADSGYTTDGVLACPYPGVRYHLSAFGIHANCPQTKEEFRKNSPKDRFELWNYCHSKLRVKVENRFGILKARTPLLDHIRFDVRKAQMICSVAFSLHNFLLFNPLQRFALLSDVLTGNRAPMSQYQQGEKVTIAKPTVDLDMLSRQEAPLMTTRYTEFKCLNAHDLSPDQQEEARQRRSSGDDTGPDPVDVAKKIAETFSSIVDENDKLSGFCLRLKASLELEKAFLERHPTYVVYFSFEDESDLDFVGLGTNIITPQQRHDIFQKALDELAYREQRERYIQEQKDANDGMVIENTDQLPEGADVDQLRFDFMGPAAGDSPQDDNIEFVDATGRRITVHNHVDAVDDETSDHHEYDLDEREQAIIQDMIGML